MAAGRACGWSWNGLAWAMWPNRCSHLAVIVEVTGGWLVLCLTSSLVHGLCMGFGECSIGTTGQMHQGVGWRLKSYTMCQHRTGELDGCRHCTVKSCAITADWIYTQSPKLVKLMSVWNDWLVKNVTVSATELHKMTYCLPWVIRSQVTDQDWRCW